MRMLRPRYTSNDMQLRTEVTLRGCGHFLDALLIIAVGMTKPENHHHAYLLSRVLPVSIYIDRAVVFGKRDLYNAPDHDRLRSL